MWPKLLSSQSTTTYGLTNITTFNPFISSSMTLQYGSCFPKFPHFFVEGRNHKKLHIEMKRVSLGFCLPSVRLNRVFLCHLCTLYSGWDFLKILFVPNPKQNISPLPLLWNHVKNKDFLVEISCFYQSIHLMFSLKFE